MTIVYVQFEGLGSKLFLETAYIHIYILNSCFKINLQNVNWT